MGESAVEELGGGGHSGYHQADPAVVRKPQPQLGCGSTDATDWESGGDIVTGSLLTLSVALHSPLTPPPGACLALMFCAGTP